MRLLKLAALGLVAALPIAFLACVPSYETQQGSADAGSDGSMAGNDAGRDAHDAMPPDMGVDASLDSASDAPGDVGTPDAATGSDAPADASALFIEGRVAIGEQPPAYFSCSVRDGGVSCGGATDGTTLGHGPDAGTDPTPGPVLDVDGGPALSAISRVFAGVGFTCALQNDQVVCWGANDYSQLGQSTGILASSSLPIPVTTAIGTLQGVRSLAGGDYAACAIDFDGGTSCWGGNVYNQTCLLDAGRSVDFATSIAAFAGARHVAGGWGGTCAAVEPDGHVVCCGISDQGQTGVVVAPDASPCAAGPCAGPVDVPTVTGAVQVAAGTYHACATLANGNIACWGRADFGQLGVDPSTVTTTCPDGSGGQQACTATPPTLVSSGSGAFIQAAVTWTATCGLVSNGQVFCWGSNGAEELGRGTGRQNGAYPTPQPVLTGPGAPLSNVVGIVGHDLIFCGVTTTGAVYCWGGGGTGVYADGGGEVAYATEAPL